MGFWIIWFIGFVITYFLLRGFARAEHRNDYNWGIVVCIFLLSLFSWVALGVLMLLVIIVRIVESLKNNEPPKWL